MIKRYGVAVICIFIFILFFFNRVVGQNDVGKIRCICLDAGHGGKDPGALGVKTYEKHIVLDVVRKLGKMIEKNYPDIKIVYTRDKDVFIDLKIRTKMANDAKADLFISVHANSVAKNKGVKGVETFVLGSNSSEQNLRVAMKENSVIRYEDDYSVKYAGFDPSKAESYIIFNLIQNMHLEKSLSVASMIQKELVKNTQQVDRDVRQAPLWVLKDASMPATLVEIGYISNSDEEHFMMSEAGQEKIVKSIFRGFEAYKNKVEKNSMLLHKGDEKTVPVSDNEVMPSAGEGLFYAIQIASGRERIKNLNSFELEDEVKEIRTGDRYRYYVGDSENYEEVRENLAKVKKNIQDCFIIAIQDGNLISVGEARILERKK